MSTSTATTGDTGDSDTGTAVPPECGRPPLEAAPAEPRASSFRGCGGRDDACDLAEACDVVVNDWMDSGFAAAAVPGSDHRCHRLCYDGACAAGETCVSRTVYSSDFTDTGLMHDPMCLCDGPSCEERGPSALPWPAEGGIATWRAEAALPDDRYYHSAAATASFLYVGGGVSIETISAYGNSATLDVLDSITAGEIGTDGLITGWSDVGVLPAPVYHHALAVHGDRLFVFGGKEATGMAATVWSASIDPSGVVGAWRVEAPLPAPRQYHHAVSDGSVLVVAGGTLSATQFTTGTDVVWWAAPDVDGVVASWNEVRVPEPVYYDAGIAVAANRLYVLGGSTQMWSASLADLTTWREEASYDWPSPAPGDSSELTSMRMMGLCDALLLVRLYGHAVTYPVLGGGVLGEARVASAIYGDANVGFASAVGPDGRTYVVGGTEAFIPIREVYDAWSTIRE